MKKIILSTSIMALMLSCGSGENHNENSEIESNETVSHEKITEENTVPEEIVYGSYDFLTKYSEDNEGFIDMLKGNNVTIIDLLVIDENNGMIRTIGYNGMQITNFTSTAAGDEIDVDGKIMGDYNGTYLSLNLINAENQTSTSIENVEFKSGADKSFKDVYHTIVNIKVNGDNITGVSPGFIEITEATLTEIKNF